MSLVKLAATKWKSMVDSLSNKSFQRLKNANIIPDKKNYIKGLETGLVKRKEALENKHGISIIEKYLNSKSFDSNKLFGSDMGIGKVKVPLPNGSVPLDSRHYNVIGPRSPSSSMAVLTSGSKNRLDKKILNLHSKQHELTEVSKMHNHVKKLPEVNIPQSIIERIKKHGLTKLTENELLQINPHQIGPNYASHFSKKVLNTDSNFIKKTPYPKIKGYVKSLRKSEEENLNLFEEGKEASKRLASKMKSGE